jgi:hypothetical protein
VAARTALSPGACWAARGGHHQPGDTDDVVPSTAVLLFAALYFARSILAPVAFSLRHLFFRKEK